MPSLTSALPRRRSLDPRPSIYFAQPRLKFWPLSDIARWQSRIRFHRADLAAGEESGGRRRD